MAASVGGLPIKVVARVNSISRNAVRVALADDGPPLIRELLRAYRDREDL